MTNITRRRVLLFASAITAGGLSAIATERASAANTDSAKSSASPATRRILADTFSSIFATTQSGIDSGIKSSGVLQTRAEQYLWWAPVRHQAGQTGAT